MTESIAAVSDVFRGSPAAAAVPAAPSETSEAVGARVRGRAMVAGTERDGKSLLAAVRGDVSGAWVWREVPPALTDVVKGWKADRAVVPGQSAPLQHAWTAYNVAVAIPATVLLYIAAWAAQHPARLLVLAALVGVPLLVLTAG